MVFLGKLVVQIGFTGLVEGFCFVVVFLFSIR